ncbi:MAG: hypothetical protein ACWGNB_04630, partial [Thiogranum sp.]
MPTIAGPAAWCSQKPAPPNQNTVKGRVHSRQARNDHPATPENSQNARALANAASALMYSLSILLFYSSAARAADNKKDVLFGSVAMDIPAVMYKRLSPLTEYLSQAIDRPVSLK